MNILGTSGLIVSELAFGSMNFGKSQFTGVGGIDARGAQEQVDRAIDAGVTLFDTADIYSGGQSEELLGTALGPRRKDIILATKVFGRTGPGAMNRGLSRAHIVASCDASLRRLGTDWIDLYQSHGWDGMVPVEESLRAYEDLIRAGKIRYIGCSNHSGWQLMKAASAAERMGTTPYISQQIQYSLAVRDAEHELLPCGITQGIGSLIWGPLAEGYLTGKYRDGGDGRLTATGRLARADSERTRATLKVLDEIAASRGGTTTPAQIAIAWLLHRPGVSSVLTGARSIAQLNDNLAAAQVVLEPAEMDRLNAVSSPDVPYPRSHQLLSSPDRNRPLPGYIAR